MKLKYVIFLALAGALIGCNKPATDTTASGTGDGKAVTSGNAGTVVNDGVPADLKKDAYDYYGLANDKPMDMEVVISGASSVLTGSQTNKKEKSDADGVVYNIERTGGLAQLGSAKVKLMNDGIYLDEVMGTKSTEKEVELPNDLTPGNTWTSHMAFKSNGSSMDVTSLCTVKGVVKFKTKVGDREGILVTSTGSGKMNGQDIKLESKNWYVKGLGGVKSELTTIVTKSGAKRSVMIEEAKQ